ncbi:MAG: DUF5615 family PIN-like protein [Terriglobia bacterium]
MKLLVDNQLPLALADWFVSRGFDCLHVAALGLAEATDSSIWQFACREERIVISKDEDFLYLAKGTTSKAGFVWIRLGNCRTPFLLSVFERLWPRIESSLKVGERIIEIR